MTRPNLGGPTRQAIALWHAAKARGVRTLLVTGAVDRDEALLSPALAGVPELSLPAALALGEAAEGWVVVPALRRGIAPFADLRAGLALRRLLRAFRPDVVHTHTSKAGWLGRRAARAWPTALVAHTFHGHVLQDYFGRLFSAWLRRQERRAAAATDVLFAVSASCADELAAAGIAARERLQVVPPAVPLLQPWSRDASRRRLELPAAGKAAVCVGRLVPIKRVADFVRAVAACPDLRGDVVGDGPERAAIEALGRDLAPGRVRCLGAVPDIAAVLPAYDALVLPSVREGCPLVAIEAFAAGVPVCGYDVPGVHDVLAELGQGVLVPAAAGVTGLAAALLGLLAAPPGAAALAAANRRAVASCLPAAVFDRQLASYLASPRCHAAPVG
ncbi:MAG: glycosyltransferase [Planctomycetes bacterium]|nr:glycosyltransferase [Planctomycetota bacterium]